MLAKTFKAFVEKRELKDTVEKDVSKEYTVLEDGSIMDGNGLLVNMEERQGSTYNLQGQKLEGELSSHT
jgi:hypothetical protein